MMTTVTIIFRNSKDQPMYLQVDPWAGFYLLKKGDKIEIVAESEKSSPQFDVDEYGTTSVLTLWDSEDYYVVIDGKRVHWEKYYLDPRLCPKCLKVLNSEETSEDICICDQGVF